LLSFWLACWFAKSIKALNANRKRPSPRGEAVFLFLEAHSETGKIMQIRLYNRQDDKEFRKLMQELYQQQGRQFDLDGADNDLRNVEGSYFGNEGLFLIAEDEGTIKAFCGARIEPGTKKETGYDTMTVKRLHVSSANETARQELIEKLLNVVKNHAYQLDFEKIEIEPSENVTY
jgi:hypothetical protein